MIFHSKSVVTKINKIGLFISIHGINAHVGIVGSNWYIHLKF